jgi:hypothetical protein
MLRMHFLFWRTEQDGTGAAHSASLGCAWTCWFASCGAAGRGLTFALVLLQAERR